MQQKQKKNFSYENKHSKYQKKKEISTKISISWKFLFFTFFFKVFITRKVHLKISQRDVIYLGISFPRIVGKLEYRRISINAKVTVIYWNSKDCHLKTVESFPITGNATRGARTKLTKEYYNN